MNENLFYIANSIKEKFVQQQIKILKYLHRKLQCEFKKIKQTMLLFSNRLDSFIYAIQTLIISILHVSNVYSKIHYRIIYEIHLRRWNTKYRGFIIIITIFTLS